MATLHSIAEKVRKCTRCPLWKHRLQALPGIGNVTAKYMIVLLSPDELADRKGNLLEGKEGRALLQLLNSLNIGVEEVFLTSLVKCGSSGSPVDTREIEECHSYLEEQVKCLKNLRKIIVVSKRPHLKLLLGAVQVESILDLEPVLSALKRSSTKRKQGNTTSKKKVVTKSSKGKKKK